MNFYKMLDIIQSKNEGRIVLCDLGCFYIVLNCCEAAMDRINRKSKIIEII